MNKEEISNAFFNIKFNCDYSISSIFDKLNNRELLKCGERGNVLQAFEDKPLDYDAWDINIFYGERMWEITQVETIELIENGPVRTSLKITRKFLESTIIQTIQIYNDIPRIDFLTWIDWKERQMLLKATFPLEIHADKATYEIQYGNVERPTHWNTSWDYARFEVCAHKWADISEDNYGVSLLNDCKYGYDIKDSVMRLTLLKSAIEPNVDSDRVIHEFTYSIYPHKGDWKKANTVKMAYNLNCPLHTLIESPHEGNLLDRFSFISIDKENVVIEVIKKAEKSNAIILRIYECFNRRTTVKTTLFKNIDKVYECDLLENNNNIMTSENNTFSFEIKPYEIKTFKIKLI
jgi:alpha-mannosidase